MKTQHSRATVLATLAGALFAALASPAQADVITDWNQRSAQVIGDARIGTPAAVRAMALVQTAAYEAALEASRAPSAPAQAIDAAVAGAHRAAVAERQPSESIRATRQHRRFATSAPAARRPTGQERAAPVKRRPTPGAALDCSVDRLRVADTLRVPALSVTS
jgi:hypothetical protein